MASNPNRQLDAPDSSLQIAFYYRLQTIREQYLGEALRRTVQEVDLEVLNDELEQMTDSEALKRIASFGLRGELFFPVPCLLERNPTLLGYYRLLLGVSQKEFYNKGPFGRFRRLEEHGEVPAKLKPELPALCAALIRGGERLVREVDQLSPDVIHDLQLLTIGPQLRGQENTRIGQAATRQVFDLCKVLTATHVKEATQRTIRIENAAGRAVIIEFSSDPDIQITEKLESGIRPIVSVEIKGGTDASNIHNRLGEAEKSHQKARNRGFFEFWTILNVTVSEDMARRESPTTSHFFHLDQILEPSQRQHRLFREHLAALLGI